MSVVEVSLARQLESGQPASLAERPSRATWGVRCTIIDCLAGPSSWRVWTSFGSQRIVHNVDTACLHWARVEVEVEVAKEAKVAEAQEACGERRKSSLWLVLCCVVLCLGARDKQAWPSRRRR